MTVLKGASLYGTEPDWSPRRHPPAWESGEAHLWSLPLEASEARLQSLLPLLTDSEQQQAARFVRPELSRRFITRRALLRRLLAAYVQLPPQAIEYGCNRFGKPFLASPQPAGDIRFNTSQSHESALVAVVRGGEVGIDVERVRPMSDFRQLSRRFFTAAEQQSIAAHAAEEQLYAFFWVWTGKEAILKACGTGIATGLQRGVITVGCQGPQLAHLDAHLGPASQWRLVPLRPAAGYVATLAASTSIAQIRYFRFAE